MGYKDGDVRNATHDDLGPVSGLWRSEDMELRSLSIERSVLERVVRRFGELGCLQFKDLNAVEEGEVALGGGEEKTKRRCFITQVRTCEAVERTLRVFEEQLLANEIDIEDNVTIDAPLGIEEFRGIADITSLPNALETIRVFLQADEKALLDQIDKLNGYKQEYDIAVEKAKVLTWAEVTCNDSLASGQRELDKAADDITAASRSDETPANALGQLIGAIDSDKMDVFHRLLYRITKGHAVVRTDNAVDNMEGRTVFRILYSSFEMQSRILKIIQSNGSSIYLARPLTASNGKTEKRMEGVHILPPNTKAFQDLKQGIQNDTNERAKLIQNTSQRVTEKLQAIARVHTARRHYIIKEKALYHCLNMMLIDKGTSFAQAYAWIPSRHIHKVAAVLHSHSLCRMGDEDLKEKDSEVPPTYFETNDFTGTFQGIVDSYGIPRYHEVNPTPFLIVTFPWLFGLMYGDTGHGLMIALASAIMIYYQDKLKKMELNEIVDMIFGARWLLLLMGLFAAYIGFLYNDSFGMMFEYSTSRFLYPTGWTDGEYDDASCFVVNASTHSVTGTLPLICAPCHVNELRWVTMGDGTTTRCTCPNAFTDPAWIGSKYSCPNYLNGETTTNNENYMRPYNGPTPFGLDAAWHEADNKLSFVNSFKMKNAVIVGVLQMSLGLVISLFNHVYFKDWKHIWFGFIPECLFLFCTFGYMCIMIITKWTTEWPNTSVAPNVLETMTNFFLSPGHYNLYDPEDCTNSGDCQGYLHLYDGQIGIQVMLIIVAVLSVPLMLIPIPVLKGRANARIIKEAAETGTEPVGLVDMQEVWIKQVIHCIEFVLGCVSNTASYLRLWALSLAHAELSEVFWDFAIIKMLDGASGIGGGFIMWLGFGAWLSATFGVLIIMEALSAFLHALRLHWVEFQTKFYAGDGRKFSPLNFAEVIADAEAAR